ncbi:MAG: prepilin-type N-terminal cleavage/methylation domain-containing protein [Candidatus Wildermuthbacteria bacterium]|nr:prepilin-type N-terminal cleavage/methylation domain-containing protein [Candidatus Wildermuthbacteria bacterium]
MNQKGFSFTELAVVLSIIVLIFLIAIPTLGIFEKQKSLDGSIQAIMGTLRIAQSKTLASDQLSSYGVYFDQVSDPQQYVLFKGDSYATRDPAQDKIFDIPSRVDLFDVAVPLGEVVFQKITGETSQAGTISLRLKSNLAKVRTIYIDSLGNVAVKQGAVPFSEDFESGNTNQWENVFVESGNTLEVVNQAAYEGSFGIRSKTNGTNDDANVQKVLEPSDDVYMRVMMKMIADVPVGNPQYFMGPTKNAMSNAAQDLISIVGVRRLSSDLNNNFYVFANGAWQDTGFDFALNTWYCVEQRVVVDSAVGRVQTWVDGALTSDQNVNTGSEYAKGVMLGANGQVSVSYYTEYYFDNFQAANTRIYCPGSLQPLDEDRVVDSRHAHIGYDSITREILTSENITLTFPNSGSPVVEQILISSNMQAGQIFWEGSVTVGGQIQELQILTHQFNDPVLGTQFSMKRDQRYNTKELIITLSGDSTGNIIHYDDDGIIISGGESIYAQTPSLQ